MFNSFSEEDFNKLPILTEGESKIIKQLDDKTVVIKFKPTIYSFTYNRAGIIPGSDVLRLRTTKKLISLLKAYGVNHSYLHINDKFVFSKLITNPPPIEVIIKAYHSGTSKYRYYDMDKYPTRSNHPLFPNAKIAADEAYPTPLIRFDWRNPLTSRDGKALADEVIGESLADLYIDVEEAKKTALNLFTSLQKILSRCNIIVYDLCLFITEDGKTVFGEISQDCGRFRSSKESLDKDIWRAGGSSDLVLQKWSLLDSLISKEYGDIF